MRSLIKEQTGFPRGYSRIKWWRTDGTNFWRKLGWLICGEGGIRMFSNILAFQVPTPHSPGLIWSWEMGKCYEKGKKHSVPTKRDFGSFTTSVIELGGEKSPGGLENKSILVWINEETRWGIIKTKRVFGAQWGYSVIWGAMGHPEGIPQRHIDSAGGKNQEEV